MSDIASKKILVVEDDEDFVFILEKKLTREGFLVVNAKNGQEGVSMVEKEKPDLILSDMLMPKMDGMTMAQKIRETNNIIPIIFLTNVSNTEDVTNTEKSLAFDYLIKSNTKMDDIVLKIKNSLGIA